MIPTPFPRPHTAGQRTVRVTPIICTPATIGAAAIALVFAGCTSSSSPAPPPATPVATTSSQTPPGPPAATASPTTSSTAVSPTPTSASVVGAVVRFSTGAEAVDVIIGADTPATRDLLSLLPTTLTLREFAGREKIADLPRRLDHQGSPGSDPEDGDLIYYIPWGNLGFYYNTAGFGFSDQTLHIGTYTATEEQLAQLEGQPLTVERVDA